MPALMGGDSFHPSINIDDMGEGAGRAMTQAGDTPRLDSPRGLGTIRVPFHAR
jgi:hypothetical protein